MVNVIETSNKFIFVCNYKNEAFSLHALLDNKLPDSTYVESHYLSSPSIFLDKDSSIPPELYSDIAMEKMAQQNL